MDCVDIQCSVPRVAPTNSISVLLITVPPSSRSSALHMFGPSQISVLHPCNCPSPSEMSMMVELGQRVHSGSDRHNLWYSACPSPSGILPFEFVATKPRFALRTVPNLFLCFVYFGLRRSSTQNEAPRSPMLFGWGVVKFGSDFVH